MNTKILIILVVVICVFSALIVSAQPYEVPAKSGLTDRNIVYIGVDKNRIIDDKSRAQQKDYSANPIEETEYKIDIENWVEPREIRRDISLRHDELEFGRGLGVDQDILKDNDAFGYGAVDAREAQYIREDLLH